MGRVVRLACAVALSAVVALIPGCAGAGLPGVSGSSGDSPLSAASSTPTGSVAASITAQLASYPTKSRAPVWGRAFRGVIDGVKTPDKVVALTFDDGPTDRTHRIVDVLDSFGAHATFFWVGSHITTDATTYSVSHGEELANHTWTHPDMNGATSQEASEQLGWTSARIAQLTGTTPTWFRSPYNRLYTLERAQVRAHGLLYANYDITSLDWAAGSTAQSVVAEIEMGLHPGGIILMHDSPNHDPLPYLPAVLSLLKARGYSMVTLSDLATMGSPEVYHLRRFHADLGQGQDSGQ